MRILYVTLENISLHKGSVVHVKEIVRGLRRLGHLVGLVAFCLNKAEEADHFYNLNLLKYPPLRLFRLKKQPYIASLLFLSIRLLRILPQYDIVYARDYHTAIVAFFPCILFEKKLVFEINGIANEEQKLKSGTLWNRLIVFLIRGTEKMATRCSDRIVSVTPQIVSYLMTNFRCPFNKTVVIGNGVDIEKFQPVRDEVFLAERKRKIGVEGGEAVIIFVGNLARWQGISNLIESVFGLLSQGIKLKLLLVGDGPLRSELMRKVLQSEFGKNFIFTGMMEHQDTPLLINLGDICVAPFILRRNRITGVSPIKIFEYMACGKPVVASRIEGLEFIEEEGAGRLIEPEDVVSLERTLAELIEKREQRAEMGAKGLLVARERFSWQSRVLEIEEVLKELA